MSERHFQKNHHKHVQDFFASIQIPEIRKSISVETLIRVVEKINQICSNRCSNVALATILRCA